MVADLPNTVEPGQGLISSMLTQAMGEQEGDMMPPLIIDDGPPSGISNFATAAVGEDGGGNNFMTMAVGEEDGNRPLPPASGPGERRN